MAVQAQSGAGCSPFTAGGVGMGMAEGALWDYGGGVALLPSRKKRARDDEVDELDPYAASYSSAELLPVPEIMQSTACRAVGSGTASTSGRQDAAVDALVRAEFGRMRAGLVQAQKRQCLGLVRAVAGAAERELRDKQAELDSIRHRSAELEERLRQAAAESQAWQGAARASEVVAAGLHATLDRLLLLTHSSAEGVGESDPACCSPVTEEADAADAQSGCFFVNAKHDAPACTATSSSVAGGNQSNKWACKACGEREASVLLLPCRHLCLCKTCEPRTDACPTCLAAKNASIYVAPSS